MSHIRPYQNSDKSSVIELWTHVGLVTANNNPEDDIQRKLSVNPELFLIAEVGEVLVGSIMGGYEGHRGWVNYLAVNPAYQRKGIARLLMSSIEVKLHALGCPKINLQVRESNSAVIQFYKALGYSNDNVVSLGKRFQENV